MLPLDTFLRPSDELAPTFIDFRVVGDDGCSNSCLRFSTKPFVTEFFLDSSVRSLVSLGVDSNEFSWPVGVVVDEPGATDDDDLLIMSESFRFFDSLFALG